jgi:hypothetical protein
MSRGRSVLRIVFAALTLLASGCADVTEQEMLDNEDLVRSETSEASSTMDIMCPTSSKATWIQAANGTVDTIAGQTKSEALFDDITTTNLTCYFLNPTPRDLDHTIQFEPGTVASACAAKAGFSGQGRQIGSVPPFGGWQFKSRRQAAKATYSQATGQCRLQLPVVNAGNAMTVKVTRPCKALGNGYRCPEGVLPIN